MFLIMIAISRGVAVAIEQPRGSLMPRCPLFLKLASKLQKLYGIEWIHTNLSWPLSLSV